MFRTLLLTFAGVLLAQYTVLAAESASLLAEWRFDEGKGSTATDSTANGHDANVHGASWVKQGDGFAISLDGEDDTVVYSGHKPLNITGPLSLEAWIKPTRKAEGELHILGTGISSYALTYYNGDNCFFYIGGGGNNLSGRLTIGEWSHVAATFDGDRMNLWINGRQIASKASKIKEYESGRGFVIGTQGRPDLPRFKGLLDNVRVYAGALDSKTITAHVMNEGADYGQDAQSSPGAPSEVVTRFFKSHPNNIDIEQHGSSILFANKRIGLEFHQTARGFLVKRLYGIDDEQDFLVGELDVGLRDLFEISMTLDPIYVGRNDGHLTKVSLMGIIDEMAGDDFPIGSHAAEKVSWRREDNESETSLVLELRGIDVRENKKVLDVDITVTLRQDDPFSYWRIAVRNRGIRYGIDRVRFPILPLAPIGDPKQNIFLFPRERGGYVEDPFNAPTGFGAGLHRGKYYSLHLNMQFNALYNKQNGKGVYFATQDPTPNLINVEIANTPSEIVWRPGHFPPNHTYAEEDYTVPYACVIGPFTGDWFDACQIYRKWAIQQSWCRKGPLATREEVPLWYKKAPLFFYTTVADSAEGTHSKEENLRLTADTFIKFLEWADMTLPIQLYAWEKYVPGQSGFERPINLRRGRTQGRWAHLAGHNWYDGNYPKLPALPNFASECKRLRQAGGVVVPYTALELFDQGPAENSPYAAEAKPNITRDLYGAMRAWGSHRSWQPCAWTPWWRNRMTEMCVLLQKQEHVGGIYLDVMQGGALPCYWVPHGHAAAGADVTTTGMHELVEQIFDAVKAQDAEAIITGENSTEAMIDVIDGILQITLWPENKVPMFATVYQDYILRYGLSVSTGVGYQGRYQDEWKRNHFFIECASVFTEGMQIGMIRLPPRDMSLSFDKPEQREMIDFLSRLVGYYKQDVTSKFLMYGQLTRPLIFSQPIEMPMLKHKQDATFPALMSGVFCHDNELGIFLVNASTEDLEFSVDVDPRRHGLDAGPVEVERITWDGKVESVGKSMNDSVQLKGTVPAHDVIMYRVK